MRRRYHLVPLSAWLIVGLLGCGPAHLQQARTGLDAAVAQLPEPDGFSIVTVIVEEFDRTWNRQRCCYGQALMAVGTDVPSEEALELYTEALKDQGWVVQPDYGTLKWTKVLCRGEYETVDVRTGAAGLITASDERYKREKDNYASFVYLTLTYSLPSRAVCQ